jgi:flavodoxin
MHRRNFLRYGMAGAGTLVYAQGGNALEYLMPTAKKKYAVIYATWCGSTKDAATWISEAMGDDTEAVDVKTGPQVSDYEGIILGSGVRMGTISPDMKSFIQTNKTALKDKVKGLFAVCGNGGNATVADATKKKYTTDANGLGGLCGVTNVPFTAFPGRIDQCGKSAGAREPLGDNLKRDDCTAFGKSVMPTFVKSTYTDTSHPLELHLSFRNSSSPVTIIDYCNQQAGTVVLTVCTMNGRTLTTIADGYQKAGRHRITWNARQFPPGTYLFRLQAGNCSVMREAQLIH